MRHDRLRMERVDTMPQQLEEGVLYYSERFRTAAHLCACGCGMKVRTPVKPTFWKLWEGPAGPSMRPSVGNWQQPCQSHYVIENGSVQWAGQWTQDEVLAGRAAEQQRTEAYYAELHAQRAGPIRRLWNKIKGLIGL